MVTLRLLRPHKRLNKGGRLTDPKPYDLPEPYQSTAAALVKWPLAEITPGWKQAQHMSSGRRALLPGDNTFKLTNDQGQAYITYRLPEGVTCTR